MDISKAIRRTGIKDAMGAAAKAAELSRSGLSKRLAGEVEFRPTELARIREHLARHLVEATPAELLAAAVELRRLRLEQAS